MPTPSGKPKVWARISPDRSTFLSSIRIWNRQTGKEEEEQIYGDLAVRWLYETGLGQNLADQVLSRNFVSSLYGFYQSSRLSGLKVRPFVRKFGIPMEEFEDGPFTSFNDFFIRRFKPGARTFVENPGEMPAFAEARYLAYERIQPETTFPVKGKALSAAELLGDPNKAAPFVGGPVLLARLCPTDYHRFHFPDEGEVLETFSMHGNLHSVNPIALLYKPEIFITNERQVTLLDTHNFGKIAYIEVGALCVGRIVQTYKGQTVTRGQEKGYFLFGGSTVIVLGEPGRWRPEMDLLEQTKMGRETLVRLGERVALRE